VPEELNGDELREDATRNTAFYDGTVLPQSMRRETLGACNGKVE
jgi:hypothetical protein